MTTNNEKAYCCVPRCLNTKKATPLKLFFSLPVGNVRKKWFTAMRRKDPLSLTGPVWCCEDHFTLEEDVEDWMRYRILKAEGKDGFLLRIKRGVLPHIFDCQEDRKVSHSKVERSAVLKRKNVEIVSQLLKVRVTQATDGPHCDELTASTSASINQSSNSVCALDVQTADSEVVELEATESSRERKEEARLADKSIQTSMVLSKDFSSQTVKVHIKEKVHFRSTATQVCPDVCSTATQFCPVDSMNAEVPNVALPKLSENQRVLHSEDDYSSLRECSFLDDLESSSNDADVDLNVSNFSDELNLFLPDIKSTESFLANDPTDEEESSEDEGSAAFRKNNYREGTIRIMKDDPKLYLGLSPTAFRSLIPPLIGFTKLPESDIFITLRKLRMNESNATLASVFGVSPSSISRCINRSFPLLADNLRSFIYWPDRKIIQSNAPLAFWANYSRVESIIDCFEIEIPKLSNPVHQSISYSSYKGCNTAKYLVSSTPYGHINFISKGFAGRATDNEIVKKSGFLDVLKEGTWIMADRGFKQLEAELVRRKCSLVRPPSVPKNYQQTKEEAMLSKSIASLRIHIERVIRRIREYKLLGPHPDLNHNLLRILDHAVVIACALTTLQGPLIR